MSLDQRNRTDEDGALDRVAASLVALVIAGCAPQLQAVLEKVDLRREAGDETVAQGERNADFAEDKMARRARIGEILAFIKKEIGDMDKIPWDRLVREALSKNGRVGNWRGVYGGEVKRRVGKVEVAVRYDFIPINEDMSNHDHSCLDVVFSFEMDGKLSVLTIHGSRTKHISFRRGYQFDEFDLDLADLREGQEFLDGDNFQGGEEERNFDWLKECMQKCVAAANQYQCNEACRDEEPGHRDSARFRKEMPDGFADIFDPLAKRMRAVFEEEMKARFRPIATKDGPRQAPKQAPFKPPLRPPKLRRAN